MLAKNPAENADSSEIPPVVLPTRPGARVMTSEELLAGQNELLIAHGQEVYRLRLTRSGKLILHK